MVEDQTRAWGGTSLGRRAGLDYWLFGQAGNQREGGCTMIRELALVLEGFPEEQRCCYHHWVIETADGPVSKGRCRLCDAEKEFRNYLQDCLRAGLEKPAEYLSEASQDRAEPDILSQAERLLEIVTANDDR